ncbi:MAG: hypothetical protein K6G61_09370 [Solobacterium sp.]|nr:hypothetical protein [Solobacterium sp.]
MVLINVTSPLLRNEIRETLLACDDPKYRYVRNIGKIEMQFEADTDDASKAVRMAKKRIRSLRFGKVIMFRVLIDGQFYENGKIYRPGDKEYKATRPAE